MLSGNSLIKKYEYFLLGYVFLYVKHMENVQLHRHNVFRCHEYISVSRKFPEVYFYMTIFNKTKFLSKVEYSCYTTEPSLNILHKESWIPGPVL